MDRKLLVTVVVGLAVVLAGCAGGGDTSQGLGGSQLQAGGDGGDAGGAPEADVPDQSGDGDQSAIDAANAQTNRAIIRTGTVRVEVENFTTARDAVERDARDMGGYVSSSDASLHRSGEETWRSGYVVVRVPSGNFSAMIAAAEAKGTVLSRSSETEDVTDRLVDLNARLENLRAERDRLRTFYEEANSTEELLQVEERLSDVQGEIERLEAQKRSLEDQVAYSTVRVELEEPAPDRGSSVRPSFSEQSPVSAFTNSVDALLFVGRTLFIGAVAAVPWLLTLAVPVVILGLVVRRYTRLG